MLPGEWCLPRRTVSLATLLLAGLATLAVAQSDPACPWLVACEYEGPAFAIRVVDQKTGQPLADVHAIAAWEMYGGNRRGVLTAVEAVSGSDGQLSFKAWGPVRSFAQGVLPSLDPVISLYRAGYRAKLIYNAAPVEQSHTARMRPFRENGDTFTMDPLQGRTPKDMVTALWEAAAPLDGGNVSQHDPEPIRLIYVRRWKRIRAEAEQLPRLPEVQNLLWQLDATIRIITPGDGR